MSDIYRLDALSVGCLFKVRPVQPAGLNENTTYVVVKVPKKGPVQVKPLDQRSLIPVRRDIDVTFVPSPLLVKFTTGQGDMPYAILAVTKPPTIQAQLEILPDVVDMGTANSELVSGPKLVSFINIEGTVFVLPKAMPVRQPDDL